MSVEDEISLEPKAYFQRSLIRKMDRVYDSLYVRNDGVNAVSLLIGVIQSLPENCQNVLKDVLNQLSKFERSGNFKNEDIRSIYSAVYDYLHRTFLSEISKGIIPTATLKGEKKKPEPKAYPKVLSSEEV